MPLIAVVLNVEALRSSRRRFRDGCAGWDSRKIEQDGQKNVLRSRLSSGLLGVHTFILVADTAYLHIVHEDELEVCQVSQTEQTWCALALGQTSYFLHPLFFICRPFELTLLITYYYSHRHFDGCKYCSS